MCNLVGRRCVGVSGESHFLHHCEGAPGPVPGEIIAAQKSQAILGSSGTNLPLIIIK